MCVSLSVQNILRLNNINLSVYNKAREDYTVNVATDKQFTGQSIGKWIEEHFYWQLKWI